MKYVFQMLSISHSHTVTQSIAQLTRTTISLCNRRPDASLTPVIAKSTASTRSTTVALSTVTTFASTSSAICASVAPSGVVATYSERTPLSFEHKISYCRLVILFSLGEGTLGVITNPLSFTSDDRWVCRKAASTEKSSIISAGPQLRAWKVAAISTV
jgi:hypothetical protein